MATATSGSPGSLYGGGGGGGGTFPAQGGGAGAPGVVVVTYTPITAPSISSVSGPVISGSTIVITGSTFIFVNAVYVNGTSVGYTVNSTTQITANVPSTYGSVSVVVQNTVGQSSGYGIFVYDVPSISSISPTAATIGSNITIYGNYFDSASAVYINGTAVGYALNSSNQITANVPSTYGSVSVVVYGPAGSSGSAALFVYNTPVVSSITPIQGNPGATVTIHGNYFDSVSAIYFGGVGATGLGGNSTQIAATAPQSHGAVYVTVSNPAGTSSATGSGIYTYLGSDIAALFMFMGF